MNEHFQKVSKKWVKKQGPIKIGGKEGGILLRDEAPATCGMVVLSHV